METKYKGFTVKLDTHDGEFSAEDEEKNVFAKDRDFSMLKKKIDAYSKGQFKRFKAIYHNQIVTVTSLTLGWGKYPNAWVSYETPKNGTYGRSREKVSLDSLYLDTPHHQQIQQELNSINDELKKLEDKRTELNKQMDNLRNMVDDKMCDLSEIEMIRKFIWEGKEF